MDYEFALKVAAEVRLAHPEYRVNVGSELGVWVVKVWDREELVMKFDGSKVAP